MIETEDGDEVLTGNRLPISPDEVVNWGARPARAAVEATVNVEARRRRRRPTARTPSELDPSTLVDAAVTWRHGPLRFTLSAHNLFDHEYDRNADGETADPGRPRQILFTISVGLK